MTHAFLPFYSQSHRLLIPPRAAPSDEPLPRRQGAKAWGSRTAHGLLYVVSVEDAAYCSIKIKPID